MDPTEMFEGDFSCEYIRDPLRVCGTCAHWQEGDFTGVDGRQGECRRLSPSWGGWHRTRYRDWCNKWMDLTGLSGVYAVRLKLVRPKDVSE